MIPGWLISLLTFPGVIAHEMAHAQFCRLLGVRVMKVCYFRFGSPAGYVVHDAPSTAAGHILVGAGPLFFNTLLGALAALPFALPSFRGQPLAYISLWLGAAIAMHSFPSRRDAANIWRGLWSRGMPLWGKLAAVPLVAVLYVGSLASALWLDLVYGVAVAIWGPRILLDAVSTVPGLLSRM